MADVVPKAGTGPFKWPVAELHPTQISVGMIEVEDKRRALAGEPKHTREEYLRKHAVPVIVGPGSRLFLIDHHHMARALWDDDIHHVFCEVQDDLAHHGETTAQFWREMAHRHWAYPHDPCGETRPFTDIPKHVAHLADDPYRSLAAYVRNEGGYEKSDTPFAEFEWANFFRPRILIGHSRAAFEESVKAAVKLAHTPEAAKLPGFVPRRAPG
jgi:hypothetical protein